MAKNIEIKARSKNFKRQSLLASQIADSGPNILQQEDLFFTTARGRLKLRRFDDGSAELIAYVRPDSEGPISSNYVRYPTNNADRLVKALGMTCGYRGTVLKKRTVFFTGSTRIHLDEVTSLGNFIELEVVLQDGMTDSEGEAIAQTLMRELEIGFEDLISEAYIDLLETIHRN